jgi:thiol-disulfide isomerase/thioredoxin
MRLLRFFVWTGLLCYATAIQGEPPKPTKDATEPAALPLTIRGTALDHVGKPVAGARVFLLTTNQVGLRESIAETTTTADGKYTFQKVSLPLDRNPQLRSPNSKLAEGTFQVYSLAEGFGITWHRKITFRTESRPKEDAKKEIVYAGEDALADLAFDLPATISGRPTNEQGQPLAGARVQVGYCDDMRRPGGSGTWLCNYLGKEADDAKSIPFDGFSSLPEKYRAAVTDQNGRYEIGGLRRDTLYLALLNPGPEYDPSQFVAATSPKELGPGKRSLGYKGEVNESFKSPWLFVVQAVTPDGQPLANVTVRAKGDRSRRAGNIGRSDPSGRAKLLLPAGKYMLFLEPPFGSPYVLTEHEVTISSETAAKDNSLVVDAGATLLIKAVEEGTGKPVAGVTFVEEIDSGIRRQELQSQTVFIDHPATDEHGELRAIVRPGERRLLVARSPNGVEPLNRASDLLKLTAKRSETVTFTMKKGAEPPALPFNLVPEDEGELGELNKLILRQRELTKAGRFEVKSHLNHLTGISGEDLRSILSACNPAEVPNLPELLRKKNPAVELRFGEMTILVDGPKARNEIETLSPFSNVKLRHILAFNGVETVSYDEGNAQASVDPHRGFTSANSLLAWQPIYKIKPRPGEAAPERKITREGGRVTVEIVYKSSTNRQVFDEKTGFLYHQSYLRNGGENGNERWQFAPRKESSGGIVPGLVVEATNQGTYGILLRVYQTTSASLGSQPPESFAIAVPSGTLILDARGKQRSPKLAVVTEPLTDVVTMANSISDNARSILAVLNDGDPAPAINAAAWLNAEGPTDKLDWKGKVMLVDFWGTGCGPCIAELPKVQEFAVKFQKSGGVLLGLHDSGADPTEVSEFVRKRGLTYQFAIDKPAQNGPSFGATFEAFGIRAIPNCAVIDQKGNVVYLGRFEEAAERATALLEVEKK